MDSVYLAALSPCWCRDGIKFHHSEKKHEFNRKSIRLAKRVLKPNGTIWVSGSFHNITCCMALEQEGFKILNNITWQKTNLQSLILSLFPYPFTETILWARKTIRKPVKLLIKLWFNERTEWWETDERCVDSSLTKQSEKWAGETSNTEPEYLLERIKLAKIKEMTTF